LNNGQPELIILVNSKKDSSHEFYYGTDGNPVTGKFDLISIFLHEIAHGLGFLESFTVTNNVGSWGYHGENPFVFDKHCIVGNNLGTSIYRLLNTSIYPNNSSILGNQLTGNNIYFDDELCDYGGQLPKLYAPAEWSQGSSIAHLDTTYPNGSSNSLMRPSIDYAEVIHSPGEYTLSILESLGWGVNGVII